MLTSTLLQAGRHWRRFAGQVLAALDISEARAAKVLWVRRLGGEVRQVTLAAYIGIEGTSVVRLINELSASGLLERRSDPEDRKANTIWLKELIPSDCSGSGRIDVR
jgi:MarR family transcriptional regulator, transcriptional regulator for hemolysin